MESKTNFKLGKIVEVHWVDACARGGWDDPEFYEDLSPVQVRTAGYQLKRNKECITIASTESIDNSINQAISIPIAWCKKIKVIRK